MNLLVSAYACEPDKGSEPGVGWAWVEMMTSFAQVTVVTRANNRPSIEARVAQGDDWVGRVEWVYYDLPGPMLWMKRATRLSQAYYIAWQYSASRIISSMTSSEHFDFVHHLTFGNYWLPCLTTPIAVPLVIGPLGGAESSAIEFATDGLRPLVFEIVRGIVRSFGERLFVVRGPLTHASVCLAKAPETASRLEALGAGNVIVHSEVVMSPYDYDRVLSTVDGDGMFRLISVGRLVHWKGYQLSLEAIARVRAQLPDFTYTVIGDGPYRHHLSRLTHELGLDDVVSFVGSVDRSTVISLLGHADVFVHPSLHDSGGWACIEAMSAALPVVCLDVGGPSTQVTFDVGVKVPVDRRSDTIDEIGSALVLLADDRELRSRMSAAARARASSVYSKPAQTAWLSSMYATLLESVVPSR